MFSNRHVIIALLVAPLLSIGAWLAVGQMVGEEAQPAESGRNYPLLAKSNCRYNSGRCELTNGNLELAIDLQSSASGWQLRLVASHPLEGALLAIEGTDGRSDPQPMLADQPGQQHWVLAMAALPAAGARLQLVAAAGGSRYYADTESTFIQHYRSVKP